MVYSFSLISFIIIAHHFLISNARPSVEDNMLIAFMKGQQEMQISEYSNQKYESHLGIVYYMRTNWNCDKITDEFEEYERNECQKYRKYLDILYEYLCREYAEIPTVKPKFVFKKEIEIDGPIIYAVNCLISISQFYFTSYWSNYNKYKLNNLFDDYFEPKLLNEERLNYELKLENESKLSIIEMILQMAIDTANEWQTNESLDGLIRQKHNKIFKENLKLSRKKEKGNINEYDLNGQMITFGLYEKEKMKKHLTQKYAAHFGVVYLMRMNWHCDKIGKRFKEKCQKYQKYLDILYEYLFRLYSEGKSNELAHKLSVVKPIFITYYEKNQSNLISVVQNLNYFSRYFWTNDRNILWYIKWNELNLKNEVELNYEIKEEENLLKKINGPKNVQKKENKILNLSNQFEENLRQEFEQKMEKIYENTKQNAKEEKVKLDKAIENAANNEEKHNLKKEYNDKFGILS